MALSKEQMREYMRKRRTEKREKNLPVPVLAEPNEADEGEKTNPATLISEARESTACTEKGSLRTLAAGQIPTYDKKKYPNRQAWEIAVQRVERATRYALKFPNLIGSDDLKFQTVDWQYQNEGLKAPAS